VAGRRGRRRKKLMDDLAEKRGYSELREEALDRTVWRSGSGTDYGPVVRQTTKRMSKWMDVKSKHGPGRLAQAAALPSVRGPNLSLHPGYN